MTHDANRCLCEECSDYRAAQVRRNRRRGLRDLSTFTPAVVTRDAAAGATNSGAVTGESVPAPEHVVAAPDPTSGHEPGDKEDVAVSRAVPSPLVRASG